MHHKDKTNEIINLKDVGKTNNAYGTVMTRVDLMSPRRKNDQNDLLIENGGVEAARVAFGKCVPTELLIKQQKALI